jgi:hypothetical protein
VAKHTYKRPLSCTDSSIAIILVLLGVLRGILHTCRSHWSKSGIKVVLTLMKICRIKVIRAEEFSVDLTTTSGDLNDEERWETEYSRDGNKFYHVLTQDERREIEAVKRRAARFVMRPTFRVAICLLF